MALNETPLDPVAAINQSFDALMQRLDDFETHILQSLDSLEVSFNRGFWKIMCLMGVGFAATIAMLSVIISRLP